MARWKWVQLNVALIRWGGEALSSARALFAEIQPLVIAWRTEGRLRWFFFMRKPPDVRLRFLTIAENEIIAQLSQRVSALQREVVIDSFCFSKYKPETSRFGGAKGISCVHEYFDADTSLWLELDRYCQRGPQIVSPRVLVPAVLHDLFIRALPDDRSVLAAWRFLQALIPFPSGAVVPKLGSIAANALRSCVLPVEEGSLVLERYAEANNALAKGLTHLSASGVLRRGLIHVLPTVGMFTLHRHGFDGHHSGVLIEGMIRALEG